MTPPVGGPCERSSCAANTPSKGGHPARSTSPTSTTSLSNARSRGEPVALNRGERIAAVRELTARGHSRRAIAERVGYTVRTVSRDRAHIKTAG